MHQTKTSDNSEVTLFPHVLEIIQESDLPETEVHTWIFRFLTYYPIGIYPRFKLTVLKPSYQSCSIRTIQCIDSMILAILVTSRYNDAIISIDPSVSGCLSLLELAPINLTVRLVAHTLSMRFAL